MLLFKKEFHAGLVDGSIDLTFRAWATPRVKVGHRYRCHPIGVLQVDAVDRVRVDTIGDAEARRAGFADRAALVAGLRAFAKTRVTGATEVYRVRLHHAGEADLVDAAADAELGDEEQAALRERLARMDARSAHGPWVFETLALIAANPRVAASQLARRVGRETKAFKADVVKLKKLGLTMSFEVGYELTPRGRALLERERAAR